MAKVGKVGFFFLMSFLILFLSFWLSIAPIYTAIFLILPIFTIIAFIKFRLAVLLLPFFAAGFIPKQLTPTFFIAGGKVGVEDCVLVLLIIICLIRIFFGKNRFTNDPLYYPFYFFFLLCILATFMALVYSNKPALLLVELRTVAYYIFVFLLSISIQNQKDLSFSLNFIVILSVLISLTVIIQSFTGIQIRSYGSVELLNTIDKDTNTGVLRSRFGGLIYMAIFSFNYILARVARKEISVLVGVLVLSIIGFAVLVTFGRGAWMAFFVSILVLSVWLGRQSFIKIWVVLLTIGLAGVLISLAIKPEFIGVVVDRALSVSEEIEVGGSVAWRKFENEEAMRTIKNKPILGAGLGGEYRRGENNSIMGNYDTIMLHNSWLWLMLKFGIVGILFPIWLVMTVFYKAKELGTSLSIAAAASLLAPIVVSTTQMEWATPFGILNITIIVGFLVAHSNLLKEEKHERTKTH